MRRELTKGQRRRLRELAGMAYGRDLSQELTDLEAQFGRWRAGEIDPHELCDRIHVFHDGPSRRLFLLYNRGDPDMAVASAIARGIVSASEAGSEVVEILKATIEYFREGNEASGERNGPAEGRV
jgi:hypothetical protein